MNLIIRLEDVATLKSRFCTKLAKLDIAPQVELVYLAPDASHSNWAAATVHGKLPPLTHPEINNRQSIRQLSGNRKDKGSVTLYKLNSICTSL